MKKFLLVVGVVLFVAAPTFAVTTMSTTLQAVIGASLSITTTIPAVKTIDVAQNSTTLGNITISSNCNNWTISLHSDNGGKMLFLTNAYPYTLTFGSESGIDLSTGDHTITKTAPQSATSSSVSIQYTKAADLTSALPAGTYEDTLTITLAST